MKRILVFAASLMLFNAAFAEVTAKKGGGGKIVATFFYASKSAQSVKVAGDFTNWQEGALDMEKTDDGFTLTKEFDAGSVLKYKFIVDGEWIADEKAPDSVDDGFGGSNSLANLDELVAPVAGEKAVKSKMHFGTFTVVGAEVKGETGKNSGLTGVGLGLKSYFKVSTEFLPKVPVYLEVAVAENDGCENLYKRGSGTNDKPELPFDKGFKRFALGLTTAPFYWFGGDKDADRSPVNANGWTYLGHFKFGIDSKWVKWETGAKYAKVPAHKINDWRTVHDWDAGWGGMGGYNYFELGSALQKIGDKVVIKAAISPNMTADREGKRYGLFSWVDLEILKNHTVSLEYDGHYDRFNHYEITEDPASNGIVLGYGGKFGPVQANANMLTNIYADKNSSKNIDGPFIHYMAFAAGATYKQGVVDNLKVWAKLRGNNSALLYSKDKSDDDLGAKNSWNFGIDSNFAVIEGVKLGNDISFKGRFDKSEDPAKGLNKVSNDKDNLNINDKLHFDIEFKPLVDFDGTLQGYAKMEINTEKADRFYRGAATTDDYASQFLLKDIGLKFTQNLKIDAVKNYAVTLDWDNTNQTAQFLTLLGEVEFKYGYKAHLGLGARIPNKDVEKDDEMNPVGFFLGMSKKFENARVGKPLFFAGFAFAMKPYKDFADGVDFKRDDYRFENGALSDYKNYMFRTGCKWDF